MEYTYKSPLEHTDALCNFFKAFRTELDKVDFDKVLDPKNFMERDAESQEETVDNLFEKCEPEF
jgi:hypothetical protein